MTAGLTTGDYMELQIRSPRYYNYMVLHKSCLDHGVFSFSWWTLMAPAWHRAGAVLCQHTSDAVCCHLNAGTLGAAGVPWAHRVWGCGQACKKLADAMAVHGVKYFIYTILALGPIKMNYLTLWHLELNY